MQLYRLEITYEAVVMAADERDAERFARDVIATESPDIQATILLRSDSLPAGWSKDSLIYHRDQLSRDLSVRNARAIVFQASNA